MSCKGRRGDKERTGEEKWSGDKLKWSLETTNKSRRKKKEWSGEEACIDRMGEWDGMGEDIE